MIKKRNTLFSRLPHDVIGFLQNFKRIRILLGYTYLDNNFWLLLQSELRYNSSSSYAYATVLLCQSYKTSSQRIGFEQEPTVMETLYLTLYN